MKRTFIITGVGSLGTSPVSARTYRVQMCDDPGGIKVWDPFDIPAHNLSPEALPRGTKFTIEVLEPVDETEEVKTVKIEDLSQLWSICDQFIQDQRITCAETVYQTDRVIENAYDFITEVCDVVGYAADGDPVDG